MTDAVSLHQALLSQKWKEKLATIEQIRPDLLYQGNGWRAAYHLIVKQLKVEKFIQIIKKKINFFYYLINQDEATANPTIEESVKLLKEMFEICKRRNAAKLPGAVPTDEEDIPSWPPEIPRFEEVVLSKPKASFFKES